MFVHFSMTGIKWWLSVLGWLGALGSWFHIVIVLGIDRGEILDYKWKVLFFLFLWIIIVCTYFNIIFTLPHPIPPEYHISSVDRISEVAEQLNLLEVNYCEICHLLKPPRTHHCKVCQRCVLRMDHHCPLLQMCVHHHNHKFFILYLIWSCLLSVFVSIIFIPYIRRIALKIWKGDQLETEDHLINSAIMNALVISVSVGSLLRFQLSILMKNRTTIEDSQLSFLDKEDMETMYIVYDLESRIANTTSLFGRSIALWPFPVFSTPGDAVNYPYTVKYGYQIDNCK